MVVDLANYLCSNNLVPVLFGRHNFPKCMHLQYDQTQPNTRADPNLTPGLLWGYIWGFLWVHF